MDSLSIVSAYRPIYTTYQPLTMRQWRELDAAKDMLNRGYHLAEVADWLGLNEKQCRLLGGSSSLQAVGV